MSNQNQEKCENDVELLHLLKQGDNVAFDKIYNLYSQKIYHNILRVVKQSDLAEEILQEVFLKIWDKRLSINIESSFKSYIFKIAHNLVMDLFRRAAFDRNLINRLAIESNSSFDNSTEDIIDFKDTQKLIDEAIELLPPQRKNVYLLCKIEGKTYQEVSELLNISTSTVSDHIVKATKLIKHHIKDIHYSIFIAAIISKIN
ncbi:RNA polymerase sigma factor [Pedobacter hiemivivus]|uniref:RNA polymerase sigma factor n=1 Tax=Pedobacter hiemivivus TaxID=2530454 RepID=A0A4R0N0D1_9SPHI|nr:RNA polymerase sigma-70 factor [Pedobacter hiemivivus]TCC93158.1 RNA polymerase sigma-70 factor [Pedobacter hiemivivus]